MQNGHDVNTHPVLARLRLILGHGIAVVCLLCAGCSSTPSPVEITNSLPQDGERPAQNDPNVAARRGLDWLAAQQNNDGTWGGPGNRVALTSLATWAFLMRGETPASDAYGKTVEDGLAVLLKREDCLIPPTPEATALLVGCLADAYSMTRIPLIIARVKQVAPLLLGAGETSPWHPSAAKTLYISGAMATDWGLAELRVIRSNLAGGEDDLLSQANLLLLTGLPEDPADMANTLFENIRRLSPGKWRESRRPLVTAFMLGNVLLEGNSTDWKAWNRSFYSDVFPRQLVEDKFGWWTPAALGLSKNPEFEGMSEDETAIYTTAVLLMTLPPERRLPSFREKPLAPPLPPEELKDPDQIEIKL